MAYIIGVESFQIANTRSVHNDSDLVSLTIRVGNHMYPPAQRWMGDVNNGNHRVDLKIGPIDVEAATPVVISYIILNTGGSSVAWAQRVKFVLNAFADAGSQNVPFGIGSLINDFLMYPFHAFEFADCDGLVVSEAISATGAALDEWLGGGMKRSEKRDYPGAQDSSTVDYGQIYESADGCGSDSKYSVTWTVEAAAANANQRLLLISEGAAAVTGFTVPHSPTQRASVATSKQLLTASFQADGSGPISQGVNPQGEFAGIVDMCGYYDQGDGLEHVIAVLDDGGVYNIATPASGGGVSASLIATNKDAARVAGYAVEPRSHAGGLPSGVEQFIVIAAKNGSVRTVRIDPSGKLHEAALVSMSAPIVSIAACYSPRDGYHHALIALSNGDIHDVQYLEPSHPFIDVRAHVDAPVDIAVYFGVRDRYIHLLTLDRNGALSEIWYPGLATAGPGGSDVRAVEQGATRLAGYYSPLDDSQHAIILNGKGEVLERRWIH